MYECSDKYNTELMSRALDDIYVHLHEVVDGQDFGFPVMRRRVYGILLHKRCIMVSVTNNGLRLLHDKFQLFLTWFYRQVGITFEDFMVASRDDVKQEIVWMKSRPMSRGKRTEVTHDCSPEDFLTAAELANLRAYELRLREKGESDFLSCVQLNQSAKDIGWE